MSERKEKFTPGPWFVNNCQVIAPNQPKIPFGERGQYSKAFIIAQPHLYVSGSQDEIRANTSLIAAAPELYELLNEYVMAYPAFSAKPVGAPGSPARFDQDEKLKLYRAAVVVLKKARGE